MKKNNQLVIFKQLFSAGSNGSAQLAKIREELDRLFNHQAIKKNVRFSLGLFTLTLLFFLAFWSRLPPKIPLFFSRPWGENQLAARNWPLIISLVYFLVAVFNLRLASFFVKKNLFLAKILVWTTTILSLLVTTTIIRIILVVI